MNEFWANLLGGAQAPTQNLVPQLAFSLEDGSEFVLDLSEERISLGRSTRNDLVIENPFISNFHAKLRRQADGNYEIADLNSTGGTFVNDERISRFVLKPGDSLRFGLLPARYILGIATSPEQAEDDAAVPVEEQAYQGREPAGHSSGPEFAELRPSPIGTTPYATSPSELPEPEPESLVTRAPELAAAMESGLAEERERLEAERSVVRIKLLKTGPDRPVAKQTPPAVKQPPPAVKQPPPAAKQPPPAAKQPPPAAKQTPPAVKQPPPAAKQPPAEVTPPKGPQPDFAAVRLELEKSKREIESVQRQIAGHPPVEPDERERPVRQPRAAQGYAVEPVIAQSPGVDDVSVRRTPRFGWFVTLVSLINLLALAAAALWVRRYLPAEVEARVAAYLASHPADIAKPNSSAAAGVPAVLAALRIPEEPKPAPTSSATSTPKPSLLDADGSTAQRELQILKERNRLTACADEAIATGMRAPYDRLWEALDDPALAHLVHAARTEILRVQNAYLSGSRLASFDIPVGAYFPEDSGLADTQLPDAKIIKLLGDPANPWEVRMKAANLLGARHSVEAGDALARAVRSDPNLDVVKEATFSFDQMTGFHCQLFDGETVERWWKEHRAQVQPPTPKTETPEPNPLLPPLSTATGAVTTQ